MSVTLPPRILPAGGAIRSRAAVFHPSPAVSIPLTLRLGRRETCRLTVATRATPANSLALAFLLPLSLVTATVLVSIKIADKLDDDYLADLALNQALEEAGDGYEEGEDGVLKPKPMEEEPVLPRTRNRPKKAAENSSVL